MSYFNGKPKKKKLAETNIGDISFSSLSSNFLLSFVEGIKELFVVVHILLQNYCKRWLKESKV